MTPDEDGPQEVLSGQFTQSAHEDIEEGVHRMADEGGGVVDQNFPAGAPILRNDLVRPSVNN